MKNLVRILIYFSILMSSCGLFAQTVESMSPEQVFVGEKFRYELQWTEGNPLDVRIPEPGLHYSDSDPDFPSFEVLFSEKKSTSFAADFSFYVTGEYSIPVHWVDKNGKMEYSKKRILVKTAITDNDLGPADILPPLVFSGPYWFRLGVFVALCVLLISFVIYCYRIYSSRRSPLDAIVQAEPMLERLEIYEIRLIELLKKSPIPARDFARALSGYIREKSASLSGKRTSSFTEGELFRFLYDQFPFEEKDLQSWKRFLTEKKFKPGDDLLSKEDAEEKFLYWKGVWDKR
ncbi:hypothetical protein EHQ12_09745 [Leptospira gomenensis]|uniref:DUF4381 domain-containing protein n=1 Tax=Leptospira gomenensis TaxID=2484974 RepID=A0A5F1YF19_9LEPT|nr:hypothetical protein [Leptospira gomenensis]TGK38406.1 hypothetical protein EHQ17_01810 [Leptospira gomenensis]TGK39326.1 hypothetical protein EHQ12_09745 [Leptospira gomenensis]TGK52220.1 hypothetical protein EHQ07_01230 [Leptospira gomenensis]TGK55793.1 hypothetical protein EHQ13_16700 [Leptospira gomenensis]